MQNSSTKVFNEIATMQIKWNMNVEQQTNGNKSENNGRKKEDEVAREAKLADARSRK